MRFSSWVSGIGEGAKVGSRFLWERLDEVLVERGWAAAVKRPFRELRLDIFSFVGSQKKIQNVKGCLQNNGLLARWEGSEM